MLQLSSKNYRFVTVRFRGDEVRFTMPRDKGDNLMRYLATPNAPSKHVVLTDIDGTIKTVHTSEILSAEPLYEYGEADLSKYTNLDELKADRKPSVQTDVLEVSDEVRQHRLEMVRKLKEEFNRKRGLK